MNTSPISDCSSRRLTNERKQENKQENKDTHDLCGDDSATGFDFEHRRQRIIDRIKLLCTVFAVELCA